MRWFMPGSLKTVNQRSVMAGMSSIVAISRTRGASNGIVGGWGSFIGCCYVDVDVDVVVSEGQSLGILVGEDFFRLAVSNESKVNSIFAT
jgi:hypothetical protein